jgi:hypothetical protein
MKERDEDDAHGHVRHPTIPSQSLLMTVRLLPSLCRV